jgi:hypothetical protein
MTQKHILQLIVLSKYLRYRSLYLLSLNLTYPYEYEFMPTFLNQFCVCVCVCVMNENFSSGISYFYVHELISPYLIKYFKGNSISNAFV